MSLEQTVIDMISRSIMTIIYVSAPPLLAGLAFGLIVSIFQAVTSIQEQTLAFVPKILAVFLAIVLFGPWMLTLLQNLFVELVQTIPELMSM